MTPLLTADYNAYILVLKEINPKRFHLSMYTEYVKTVKIHPEVKLEIKPLSKIDMLMALAHEIAHLRYWDHCPKRQILESELTAMFMVELAKSGYISEEESESIEH
jgi:hypothetical protein